MPIITPAYPAMNSTYNVSESTLNIMKQELQRGTFTTTKIETEGASWTSLFEKCDFFNMYKAYVQIELVAEKEDEHRKWYELFHKRTQSCREGWVESRLRFLILNLEQTPNLQHAHPHPKFFPCHVTDENKAIVSCCSCFFMGLILNLPATGPKTVDLTPAVSDFTAAVKEWAPKTPSMDIHVRYLNKLVATWPVLTCC
jgi:poly(A) polymerase